MFRRYVRRNLIAMLIPVIVMEILVIFMTVQLGLLDDYRSYEITDMKDLELYYMEGKRNVVIQVDDPLTYAGFDAASDEGKQGSYYYQFNGDSIRLFILKDETIRAINFGENNRVYARIIRDEVTAGYIEKEYTSEVGLGDGLFDGFVEPIIIDELSYPELKIKGIRYVNLAARVMLAGTWLYMLVGFCFPVLAFGYRSKKMFKNRREMLSVMDAELEDSLLRSSGHEFVTYNYLVYIYLSRIEVIKKSDINMDSDDDLYLDDDFEDVIEDDIEDDIEENT